MAKRIKALLTLILAWLVLNIFRRDLYQKDIWLIEEKGNEARDNGYHFFKFMRTKYPERNAYFVITLDSPDYYKIKEYGNIVVLNSFKHFLYYLAARYSINSQPMGAVPNPDTFLYRFRTMTNIKQKVIFLQHGVIKDDLGNVLDYNQTKFDLFCCSAKRERNYVQESCHYPDGIVQELGLCRFDALFQNRSDSRKQILVMPTFRGWLKPADTSKEASDEEKLDFMQDTFFQQYSMLLSNEDLLNSLRRYGYKLLFYPHYAMQPYIHCFDKLSSELVVIADRQHYDVQQLMIDSAVMVTDFSSVFFDFAYMEKPEVFFQFDEDKYRAKHYKPGYFDYRRDGFGPVFTESKDVTEYLVKLMENNCRIEQQYLNRIQDFFDLRDNHNCERTYQAIIDLHKE